MWKQKLFYFLQGTPIHILLKKIIIWRWKRAGSPIPPPYTVKREEIKRVAREFNCEIFVETGTFLGATTAEVLKCFKKLYTIELSDELFKQAQRKFSKYPQLTTLHGDSGKVLFDVVEEIDSTVLFWLDGHYSGGITAKGDTTCPIFKELEAIFQLKNINYVLMIDDARCFGSSIDTEYPTIEILEEYVNENSPTKMILDIKMDIISFKPQK
jgi:hypothetical protein